MYSILVQDQTVLTTFFVYSINYSIIIVQARCIIIETKEVAVLDLRDFFFFRMGTHVNAEMRSTVSYTYLDVL
jgi:hypothetical protein